MFGSGVPGGGVPQLVREYAQLELFTGLAWLGLALDSELHVYGDGAGAHAVP